MKLEPADIDRGLEELLGLVRAEPGVEAELAASPAEFFSRGARLGADDEARRAARRQLEWFLLERPSAALGGVPVEWALHRFGELDADELTEDQLRALLSTRCSVFEVTGVSAGEGVWVRDLAAMGEYPLSEPEGSHALEAGDVIVGRLFAIGEALYRVSPAAGVFRSPELLRALTVDLEQLRNGRRGVLRLSQSELETMFWQRVDAPGDPVGAARSFLVASGLVEASADEILAELSRVPFDESRVVVGARDVLGAILDRLAFDTEVDLEASRRVLLAAWAKLHEQERAPAPRPEPAEQERPADVREAIAAFDRGRSEGRDLDLLFQQLERDLDLEPEDYDPDAIDGAPAPDFPGVVGAMVEEFLWETERERGGAEARALAPLRAFAEFGADYGVFENLGERELVLFATVWLPEQRLLRSGDDARAMLKALRAFSAWSQETQDVPLLDAYRAQLGPVEQSLPRLVEANRWSAKSGPGTRSEIVELLSTSGGSARVRDRRGDVHEVALDARIGIALLPGDRLRSQRERDGALTVYCAYPPESRLVAP
jgi:hypothetical protein